MKLYGKLLCFCNKYTKDEHEADNVVSEIFFKMLRYERPEQIENIEAFLYKMAKNYLIDQKEKEANRKKLMKDHLSYLPHTCQSSVEDDMTKEEIVAHLPKRKKEIWQLSQDGYKDQEIADMLQLSQQTVANLKSEIKQKLQLVVKMHIK